MAGDVLDMLTMVPDESFPNMRVRKASRSQEDDQELEVGPIVRNKLSGAILASGPPVPHYALDAQGKQQFLSVRDVASLQSYPYDYKFFGNKKQQYKQVGNSVPCGLASALAGAAALVLRFVYQEELSDTFGASIMIPDAIEEDENKETPDEEMADAVAAEQLQV